MMTNIILGLLLLVAGKRLFWLSVGILGFLVGIDFATGLLGPNDVLISILAAISFGILGAVLAVSFQWITILLVGFLGGGYFLLNIASAPAEVGGWLFMIGGVIGLVVMLLAFDWALIVMTSLIGAMIILEHLAMDQGLRTLLFIILSMVGVLLQYPSIKSSHSREESFKRVENYPV